VSETHHHRFSDHLTISRILLDPINSQSNSVFADFLTWAFSAADMMEKRALARLLIAIVVTHPS
tara:strand:- start:409 stop:600 length:192 start_codon:yes stop_codon:yes gene_type:complete